jgi:hypothetical protein
VRRGEGDKVQFHRVAVGDHLILGGDNLDLALARHVEQQLGGIARAASVGRLGPDVSPRERRRAQRPLPRIAQLQLPGTGSKLIGGGVRVVVDREEARRVLLDGFFPPVAFEDRPVKQQSGFREFGLPYASDPAITRYLAAFLAAHRFAGEPEERYASRCGAGQGRGGRPGSARYRAVQRRRVQLRR